MLYNLFIAPIETIVDWVFLFINNLTNSYGVIYSVVGVSLVINFLALPLYNIADRLQEKERQVSMKMQYRVKRIKKAFKGDEQFMMLSTYYRQNDYHPFYVLRGSLSILIQIPFFMAAYNYLSNSEILLGSKFWIFKDLGKPDALFTIKLFGQSLVINTLPILMTLINFVSGAVYTKDAPIKEKVQVYLVAIIFLALLYNSPAGLVIYWILNNIFSLVKNIVMKMKNPGRICYICILALCLMALGPICFKRPTKKVLIVSFTILCVLLLPIIIILINKKHSSLFKTKFFWKLDNTNFTIALLSGLSISLLIGFLLPTNIITTSPREFSFLGNTDNPISYVVSSFCVYLGLFSLWPLCIYKMFGDGVKKIEPLFLFTLSLFFLINAYVIKSDYGTLNIWLQLEKQSVLRNKSLSKTFLTVLGIIIPVIIYLITVKYNKRNILAVFLFSLCLAEIGLGVYNTGKIKSEYLAYKVDLEGKTNTQTSRDLSGTVQPRFHLSKTENNVVVLFLDRAIGSFFPQTLEELPQLGEKFDGFTYYPNSSSFATCTNMSVPQIFGGYEYTPENINKRSKDLLKDKHNESLRVLPSLFRDGGYSVTISDPPCVNYTTKGDLAPLTKKTGFDVFEIEGTYAELCKKETGYSNPNEKGIDVVTRKEIRNFCMLQVIPIDFRGIFNNLCRNVSIDTKSFFASFSSLYYLNDLTDFEASSPSFIYIDNETPHRTTSLIAPEYEQVDLSRHDYENNPELNISLQEHYDVFTASMIQVGKWLDYLRENDVYDNTRIIILSDHGYKLPVEPFDKFKITNSAAHYNILMMMKDFNSHGSLETDDTFMTTADTLFLAKEDLGLSNINPETGKELVQDKENGINVYPFQGNDNNVNKLKEKTKFTLKKDKGFHIQDNIFDEKNWMKISDYEKTKEEE